MIKKGLLFDTPGLFSMSDSASFTEMRLCVVDRTLALQSQMPTLLFRVNHRVSSMTNQTWLCSLITCDIHQN